MREKIVKWLEDNCEKKETNHFGNIVYHFGNEHLLVGNSQITMANIDTLNFQFYSFEKFLAMIENEVVINE